MWNTVPGVAFGGTTACTVLPSGNTTAICWPGDASGGTGTAMVCVGGGTSAMGTATGVLSTTTGSFGAFNLLSSTIFAWTFDSFSRILTSCFACDALTPFASPWE